MNPIVTSRPYRDAVLFLTTFFQIAIAPLSVNQNQILFFLLQGDGPSYIHTNLQQAIVINKASMATRVRHMKKFTIQHKLSTHQGT